MDEDIFSGGERHVQDSEGNTYVVGGIWGDITRAAKKVGNTAGKVGKVIVKPQVLKMVAPIVASVIPGGGVAYAAAMQAKNIIDAAKAKHPDAVAAIAVIQKEVEGGNPKAVEVAKLMRSMSDKMDQKMQALVAAQKAAATTPTVSTVSPQTSQASPPAYSESIAPTPQKSGGNAMLYGMAALAGVGLLFAVTRKH